MSRLGKSQIITWERCRQRVKDGAFDFFSSRICRVKDYDTVPALVVEGEKTAKYRVTHAPYGIVNVYSRKCRARLEVAASPSRSEWQV